MGQYPCPTCQRKQEVYLWVSEKSARAADFELAIQWLIDAGLAYKVQRVNTPRLPFKFYEDLNAFKLFMLDVGLMGAMAETSAESMLVGDGIFSEYK